MADKTLEEGTQAHYRDGRYYDHRYRRRRHDVPYYRELARNCGGPVLELGAGTGRVTRAMAATGVEVVGVDAMRPMLEQAETRLAREPKRMRNRVSYVHADLREVRLEQRFALVVAPFNVFMHLYTRDDIERALTTVKAHLMPDVGRFAFDVMMPDPRSLARDPTRLYKSRAIRHPRDGKRYEYREAFSYDRVSQVQIISTMLEEPNVPDTLEVSQLDHRQFFPQELAALLHYNDFRVLRHGGDFDGGGLHSHCESQVILAVATAS